MTDISTCRSTARFSLLLSTTFPISCIADTLVCISSVTCLMLNPRFLNHSGLIFPVVGTIIDSNSKFQLSGAQNFMSSFIHLFLFTHVASNPLGNNQNISRSHCLLPPLFHQLTTWNKPPSSLLWISHLLTDLVSPPLISMVRSQPRNPRDETKSYLSSAQNSPWLPISLK